MRRMRAHYGHHWAIKMGAPLLAALKKIAIKVLGE
jgi:hypothetical protein